MSVEQKIVEASKDKIKALAPRAAKAAKNPETGVKILVAGAKFVIRDCAQITIDYLPLKLYGGIVDPLKELNGVFTKKEIEAFVTRGKTEICAKHLCNIMMLDAYKKGHIVTPKQVEPVNDVDVDDVYGDYGSDTYTEEPEEFEFDFEDASKIVEVLCKAFKAK